MVPVYGSRTIQVGRPLAPVRPYSGSTNSPPRPQKLPGPAYMTTHSTCRMLVSAVAQRSALGETLHSLQLSSRLNSIAYRCPEEIGPSRDGAADRMRLWRIVTANETQEHAFIYFTIRYIRFGRNRSCAEGPANLLARAAFRGQRGEELVLSDVGKGSVAWPCLLPGLESSGMDFYNIYIYIFISASTSCKRVTSSYFFVSCGLTGLLYLFSFGTTDSTRVGTLQFSELKPRVKVPDTELIFWGP